MRIAERYGQGRPVFSFEFFPPKTDPGFKSLYRTIQDLKRLNPDFVSVTWGAGGSTRRKTVEIVVRIQREIGITAMAHLSCIGSTQEQLAATLDELERGGIENVLTLGGDRPEGYEPPPGAFQYANELAGFIRARSNFCLGGACYPETHPAAPDPETDLENLQRKVNAGVEFLITQLFFDNADFFDFVRRARAKGIGVPIVPGIMPILNAASIGRMTSLSGAKIPEELQARLSEVEHDDAATREVGVEWATHQCRKLLEHDVPGIHFYTLNKSTATRAIFQKLLEGWESR
jgi:methylenetetrahydrofolate reductase (NADPH)